MVARELTKKFEEHIGNNINEVIEFFNNKNVIGEITIVLKGINKKRDLKNDKSKLNFLEKKMKLTLVKLSLKLVK